MGLGGNEHGEIGDGTTTDRIRPVKIMDNAAVVSAALYCSMAIQTDGTLWAWGLNDDGQLGDGTATSRNTPVKVMDDARFVSLGQYFTMAIKTDGSLWAWGRNGYDASVGIRGGFLGDGTTINRDTPVKVMDNAAFVSAGAFRAMAIKTDGSLWGWGNNGFGQLGGGANTEDISSPVKVMDNAAAASLGVWHTLVVKTDGTLWAFGSNDDGQLGDGADASGSVPIQIMDGVMLPK